MCIIYGQQHNVNELRYYPFGSLTKDPSRLPPCEDAVYKHIMRSNYQAAIWRRILLAPTRTWLEGESEQRFHRHTCPQTCSYLVSFSCKCKSCKDKRCTCCRNSLKCTSACGCKSICDNAIEVCATNVIQDSDDDSDFG